MSHFCSCSRTEVREQTQPDLALLRTCRGIFADARRYLWTTTPYTLYGFQAASTFVQRMQHDPDAQSCLSRLTIDLRSDDFDDGSKSWFRGSMKHFTNLQDLTVKIDFRQADRLPEIVKQGGELDAISMILFKLKSPALRRYTLIVDGPDCSELEYKDYVDDDWLVVLIWAEKMVRGLQGRSKHGKLAVRLQTNCTDYDVEVIEGDMLEAD